MMIWIKHWTCVDHHTTMAKSQLVKSGNPTLSSLTDEKEKLQARLDLIPKIEPAHNTQ